MSTAPRPAPARAPWPVTLVAGIAIVVIAGPVIALAGRVPWPRFTEVLREPATAEMLSVTLYAAVQSTIITLLLGVPLAVWLSTLRRGAGAVRLLVLLPLAMPPVVAGLALTAAIGNRGLLAPLLDVPGLQFAFAFPGVVAAHVFITLPYVVVAVEASLRQIDHEILASAAGVGMTPAEILRKITLPAIAPAIGTGGGLALARSLGEFGTTLTFAGSMPGVTRTMPLGIYLEREVDPGGAYVLAAVLIVLAVVALALAGLPTVLRRTPAPAPRTLGDFDAARIRQLCRPTVGPAVTHEAEGVCTRFPAGATTAVIGPNGSGKTTMVGTVAGRLRGARIRVGEREVDGARFIPARERGVVLLTQRPGLPRTTTVAGAVTMATRSKELTGQLLDAAGLSPLADVPVPALSGGQAAQVALVRALGARPEVLILDEPLAAIDVAATARWRRLLRSTAADRTTIMVTHDPVDIAGLADHLVVLERGATVAQGPPAELLAVPPTSFVAALAGVNRVPGMISAIGSDTVNINADGQVVTGVADPGAELRVGEHAVATIDPAATTLRLPGVVARDSARNLWRGTVVELAAAGRTQVDVTVRLGQATTVLVPVTHASAVDLDLQPGTQVECVTKALSVRVHPRAH